MQSEVGWYSILHSIEGCFPGIFRSPVQWLNRNDEQWKQPSDIGTSRTRLLLIGQVLINKLKEGSTWTSCKPKPKALCALCEYCLPVYTLTYLCIHVHNIITSYHSIFNNHFKDLEGSVDAGLRWTRHLSRGNGVSPLTNPVKVQVQQLESVAMTHSTWWAWF